MNLLQKLFGSKKSSSKLSIFEYHDNVLLNSKAETDILMFYYGAYRASNHSDSPLIGMTYAEQIKWVIAGVH